MALAAMLGSAAVEADEEELDVSITGMFGDCAVTDDEAEVWIVEKCYVCAMCVRCLCV